MICLKPWFPLMIVGVLLSATIAAARDANPPPNIVLILADDLGYGDLGCYGQKRIRTPNIDRLAAQGVRFTQAYAGSTVCAPSRGVLMTGLHNGHCPVRDNVPHYRTYLQAHDTTIAEMLQAAGYRCGGIGKWSLGDPGTVGRPTSQGFDTWLGYFNQDHAHYYYPEYLDLDEGRLELPGNSDSHEHYSHDLMTEHALRFIREASRGPFFLYAAYTLPHFSSASEDETQLAIPSDAPYSKEPWSRAEKNYASMITLLDRDVGRIAELIEELGLTEKTLVIFTSDNGPWGGAPKSFNSSGPLRGSKRELYEGGVRVPFIARWPGSIPEGRVSHEVIAFWDMLPTFAELSGAELPTAIDGISVVEALKGKRLSQPHAYLYWDYGHCRRRYDQAVRLEDWKGIRLGRNGRVQLYDLKSDPGEKRDVADRHPDVVERISQIMETASEPSDRYPIGVLYKGKPLWRPSKPLDHAAPIH